jgi:hypothetical protein
MDYDVREMGGRLSKDVGSHTYSRYPYHPTTMRLFDFSDTDSTLISLSSISVRLSRRRNH